MHSRFAFTHLHLFEHAFLHPHFNSSWQSLAASGRVDQHGFDVLSLVALLQPHKCCDGSSGLATRHTVFKYGRLDKQPFQVMVEGMEYRWNIIHLPVLIEQIIKSSVIHLLDNRCFWYNTTTNLSICSMSAKDTSHGSCDSLANNGVR